MNQQQKTIQAVPHESNLPKTVLLVTAVLLTLTGCAQQVVPMPSGYAAGPGFVSAFAEGGTTLSPVSVPVPQNLNIDYLAYWQQASPSFLFDSVLDPCSGGQDTCSKLFFAGELDKVVQVMDAPSPDTPGTPAIRQIPLTYNITDLATSEAEDGGYVFASHAYAGGISVILPGSEKLYKFWSSPAVPEPDALSVHRDWGYVLSGSVLARFHVEDDTPETLDLGGNPDHLSDGYGGIVGVTDFGANVVHLVTTSGVWYDSPVTVPSPGRITVSKNQWLAFVATVPNTVNGVTPTGSVYVIDTRNKQVIKSIPVGNCVSSMKIFLTGDSDPLSLDQNITDEALIVANQCDATITKIDLSTLQVVGTYPARGQPHALAVQP